MNIIKKILNMPIYRYKFEFNALDEKGRKICVEEVAHSSFIASLQAQKWFEKTHPEFADKAIEVTVYEIDGDIAE